MKVVVKYNNEDRESTARLERVTRTLEEPMDIQVEITNTSSQEG